jgi:hypothetical protein
MASHSLRLRVSAEPVAIVNAAQFPSRRLGVSYQKTTVEIDVEELERARETLHTQGIKETVNAALREVNRKAALERAAAYVLAGRMHVPDEESWSGWRERRGS